MIFNDGPEVQKWLANYTPDFDDDAQYAVEPVRKSDMYYQMALLEILEAFNRPKLTYETVMRDFVGPAIAREINDYEFMIS